MPKEEKKSKSSEVFAKAKYLKISPKKVKYVLDLVRGMSAEEAQNQLKFIPKKASKYTLKLLNSAIANAEHNFNFKKDNLYIKKITVDEGPTLKRWMPKALGRATVIRKRSSHINIVLDEKVKSKQEEKKVKKEAIEKPIILKEEMKEKQVISKGDKKEELSSATGEHKAKVFDDSREGKYKQKDHTNIIRRKNEKGFLKKFFNRKVN
ncbi:MAG: ribosomal protein L22, bacterial type [Parcubacteria group bacterium Athens1014_10]|nr:MAG: ribosomal protein L22, bacterial type [Parcubacteria group bacterium Athens1014_10]TSD05494.1 MAG: ribosomal protein L22, bacterial type [Parcubacteria group bacterium Athens0714_12]